MEGFKNIEQRVNIRVLMGVGFILTIPSVIFWLLVLYTRLFHDHKYIDTLLSSGGIFLDILIKGLFPFASLVIAVICNKALRHEALEKNVWHRQTDMMRANQKLINWNAILILAMIFSLINN
jgi:hypothetical protein